MTKPDLERITKMMQDTDQDEPFFTWLWDVKGLTRSHYAGMHWRDHDSLWRIYLRSLQPAEVRPGIFSDWRTAVKVVWPLAVITGFVWLAVFLREWWH